MALSDVDRSAVMRAVAQFDQLGRDAFLEQHGFGRARAYFLLHDGKFYDSKAIVGVAHGFARPDEGALKASDFSGGEATVAQVLRKLGFEMRDVDSRAVARTWIFQCNPDRFDIEGYLATRPTFISWLVSRYADQISVGDRVYLWRTGGAGSREEAGIIAETFVTKPASLRPDDAEARPFWIDRSEADQVATRCVLGIAKVANEREKVKRSWLTQDPVLRDLPNLKMAAGTNYPVPPQLEGRLAVLWAKTGRDWSWDEAVAALLLYHSTYGMELSRSPTSEVAKTAVLIGRAVSGVYNKVLNFRSIDPRDERKGLGGSSSVDQRVWDQFYDTSSATLREADLRAEFERLWGGADKSVDIDYEAFAETLESEASKLAGFDLDHLLRAYTATRVAKAHRPRAEISSTRVYDRDPLVHAIAKLRADHSCEVPGCEHPQFTSTHGKPYCEVHHIVPLSEGGDDSIENVACLCPAHHREVHNGKEADRVKASLVAVRRADPTLQG